MKSPLIYGVNHWQYDTGKNKLPVECACSAKGADFFFIVTNETIISSK